MAALRSFHERRLRGVKSFDPFAELLFYETLMPAGARRGSAYTAVRGQVFSLRPFVASFLAGAEILCHIDAVSDNFLFVEGRERPYLIDWEYAGLSDPLIDIAMFVPSMRTIVRMRQSSSSRRTSRRALMRCCVHASIPIWRWVDSSGTIGVSIKARSA